MGILPYQTPVENKRMDRSIQHFKDFCKLKGYEVLFDRGFGPHPCSPWLGKNGKTYTDRELFRKDNGWYPYLIKDGVCYGWYEPATLDNYKDPYQEECKFLESQGYTHSGDIIEDYIENINLQRAFYEKYGWLPRWKKDNVMEGHIELLLKLDYKYTGEPDYPVLLESEKDKRFV